MSKYNFLSFTFFVSVMIFACGQASVARAQMINPYADKEKMEDYAKPMPDIALMDKKEFEGKTTLYHEKPFNDAALAYSVRIAKEWKKDGDVQIKQDPVNKKGEGGKTAEKIADVKNFNNQIFGDIGFYYGPVSTDSGFGSQLKITALDLSYEQSAEQWFMQHLITNGYALQGIKAYSEDRVEALYVLLKNDVSFVVRAVAVRNGAKIILAEYSMPIELWATDKVLQANVIDSFRLANEKMELAEKMKIYHFLDIAKLQYPESWNLKAPPLRNADQMKIEIRNITDRGERKERDTIILDGLITVRLSSVYETETLQEEVLKHKTDITETGLELKEEIVITEKDRIVFNAEFSAPELKVYKAIDKNEKLLDYEYWMAVMTYGEYYYFITLLTPSREQDLKAWTRNTETFKVMLPLLEPQADSLIEE